MRICTDSRLKSFLVFSGIVAMMIISACSQTDSPNSTAQPTTTQFPMPGAISAAATLARDKISATITVTDHANNDVLSRNMDIVGDKASVTLPLKPGDYDLILEFKYFSVAFGNRDYVIAYTDPQVVTVSQNKMEVINISNYRLDADEDFDTYSNLQELKSGTDPRTSNDKPQPAIGALVGNSIIQGTHTIEIQFDRSMDPASLVVSGSLQPEAVAGWSRRNVDYDTLKFNPASTWSAGSNKTLAISANDSADLPMEALNLTFIVDNTAPTATSNPANQSLMRSTTPIKLTFSESMDPNSVTFSGNASSSSDGGVWSINNQVITLTPNPIWPLNASLGLSVSGSDLAGNAINADFSYTVGWLGSYVYFSSYPRHAVMNNDTMYVAGSTSVSVATDGSGKTGTSDYFVAKIDLNGNVIWVRQNGVINVATDGYAVAAGSGRVYVTGRTVGNLDGNTLVGINDLFVAAYDDNTGNRLWTRTVGVANTAIQGYGVAVDPTNGDVVATGNFSDGVNGIHTMRLYKYTPAGTLIWSVELGPTWVTGADVKVDALGNILVTGYTSSNLAGVPTVAIHDYYIAKYSSAGTLTWVRQVGSTITEGTRLAIDNQNNIIVTGHTSGPISGATLVGSDDVFVTKYNSSGTLLWTKIIGDSAGGSWSRGTAVAVDASDNVAIVGYDRYGIDGSSVPGTNNAYAAKFSSAGTKLWVRDVSVSSRVTNAFGVVTDSSGAIYMSGFTSGNFEQYNVTTASLFITKYSSAGVKQ